MHLRNTRGEINERQIYVYVVGMLLRLFVYLRSWSCRLRLEKLQRFVSQDSQREKAHFFVLVVPKEWLWRLGSGSAAACHTCGSSQLVRIRSPIMHTLSALRWEKHTLHRKLWPKWKATSKVLSVESTVCRQGKRTARLTV